MSSCNGNCSSCGSDCADRQAESLLAEPNPKSSVKKVIAVVSGKGGVGKSTVTAMLQHGQGDIGNGGEPQISEGITAGIWEEPFVKFPDLGDYAYSIIGVKKSTIENDPDTCRKFVRAMLRALSAVQEDHALAARVLEMEFSTLTEEGRAAALGRAYDDCLWSEDGVITPEAVDMTMTVLSASGLYEGEWAYDQLVDMRFVEELSAQ